MTPRDDKEQEVAVIDAFVQRVNARAEADMLAGNPITGAHHRALTAEHLKVTRDVTPPASESVPSAHTPGPWTIVRFTDSLGESYIAISGHEVVCLYECEVETERDTANARLIAAAPKLLAALKMILAEPYGCPVCDSGKLRHPDLHHWHDCGFAAARAALASASGKAEAT